MYKTAVFSHKIAELSGFLKLACNMHKSMV